MSARPARPAAPPVGVAPGGGPRPARGDATATVLAPGGACSCPRGVEDIRCPTHGPDAVYTPPVPVGVFDPRPIILRLPFDRPPLTTNEARAASGWGPEHRAKKLVQSATYRVVRHARVPRLQQVRITLTWYTRDRHTRDCGLLFPMAKAAIDALTPPRPPLLAGTRTKSGGTRKTTREAKIGAGVIAADDAGVVISETLAIVLADPDPRIELRIDPVA
jgi:hypothetical protein